MSGALSALQFVSGRYPLVNLQKTMLSIGKSTISMVIFHNYVKLPKGNNTGFSTSPWCRSTSGTMSLEVMPSCRIYGRWNFEMRDPRNRTSSEFPKWKERHVSNPGPWLEPRAWNHDILPVNWTYRKSAHLGLNILGNNPKYGWTHPFPYISHESFPHVLEIF